MNMNMNNDVLNILLSVEKPLVLSKCDTAMECGLTVMDWKSNGINEFIVNFMEQVNALNDVVRIMKENLRLITSQLVSYNKP